MDWHKVQASCKRLSGLQLNLLRTTVLKLEPDHVQLSHGQVLLFWFADWLAGVNLLKADQMLGVCHFLGKSIVEFGDKLGKTIETAGAPQSTKAMKLLPVCKVGFLDREYVCIDGVDSFSSLSSGETVKVLSLMPIESIIYNLTSIYVRYLGQTKRN
jgi:hypothetical protein